MRRIPWLIGLALLLAGACGGGSSPAPLSVSVQLTNGGAFVSGGSLASSTSGLPLYASNWVQNQGFRVYVSGKVSGGTRPYRVKLTPLSDPQADVQYEPGESAPINGVIFVPAHGDPRIRVQVTDSTVPKPQIFNQLLPTSFQNAPAAPIHLSPPVIRIIGLPDRNHPCSPTLSVVVSGVTRYDAFWTGGKIAARKVYSLRTQKLQANFDRSESVTVVVRDLDSGEEGRPAAIMSRIVC